MGRKPCCEKTGLKRGKWSVEEDERLINYIKEHGEGGWRLLPKNAGLLRCGKSCRLRWINYLRSDVKRGNFTQDEEELIIELHKILGTKWSLIAKHLPWRTDNDIKNYWNSHLSRKVYRFRPNSSSISKSSFHVSDMKQEMQFGNATTAATNNTDSFACADCCWSVEQQFDQDTLFMQLEQNGENNSTRNGNFSAWEPEDFTQFECYLDVGNQQLGATTGYDQELWSNQLAMVCNWP